MFLEINHALKSQINCKAIILLAQLEFVLSFDFSHERYKENWKKQTWNKVESICGWRISQLVLANLFLFLCDLPDIFTDPFLQAALFLDQWVYRLCFCLKKVLVEFFSLLQKNSIDKWNCRDGKWSLIFYNVVQYLYKKVDEQCQPNARPFLQKIESLLEFTVSSI